MMKTHECIARENMILGPQWGANRLTSLLWLCFFLFHIQGVFCQVIDEPHVPTVIEKSIRWKFQYNFLTSRLLWDERNLKYRSSLGNDYYSFYAKNYRTLSMSIKPVGELYGVPLKDVCLIELTRPYEFIDQATKKRETHYLNDSIYPFGDKFLIYYVVKNDHYPFEVDLYYISGNIKWEVSPYNWIVPLLGEDNTELKRNAKAAELYLKFRLFSYSASEPKLNKKAAKDLQLDYWSFLVNKIDIVGGRACEARVYKGYSGDHVGAYVIDLIYYVDSIPKEFSRLPSNAKGTYKVTWRISDRSWEYFYPEYKLLSDTEKRELIDKGKFYQFFHKQ
ncbi:hypothetical protein [Haliscomenobacter hydrossis]|uniref:Uncharacterized protein n=1 Tax=Haliscomenobacter hydrossis (strain ATCC 27775 / DSM 1100 / LMG 10767 / O) TaxID=760192 RepID=F4KW80_HALH1|nr:hypothetical protein [Haliscomenobacter hydrossis]AEE49268.1 hypothetical protein Halhy_1373 [Haliscomenobacter hydrossis DSM 1100]